MACEVIIKIKDKSKSMTQKTKTYNRIDADLSDPFIDDLISKAERAFGESTFISKVDVTIKLIKD